MEHVYNVEGCNWISEPVRISDFFKEYSDKFPQSVKEQRPLICGTRKAEIILPLMGVTLSREHFEELSAYCADELLNVPGEPSPLNLHSVKRRQTLFEQNNIPSKEECSLATIAYLREVDKEAYKLALKYNATLWINNEKKIKKRDLSPNKDIVLFVRVYETFKYNEKYSKRTPWFQELAVLGHQTLDILCDKITCPADMVTEGELSNRIGTTDVVRAKTLFKSGFFFIENTFYNDFRDPDNCDYSECIEKWSRMKGFGPFNKDLMESTKFEDLTIRFGYPYVYVHQGKCEHLIVFTDARLLHEKDHLCTKSYPLNVTVASRRSCYCMICSHFIARWVTFDNERVVTDPFFFCENCFISYNYIDNKKIGNFKAYEFHHPSYNIEN